MKYSAILLLSLLFIQNNSFAQNNTDIPAKWTLTAVPLSMFDFNPRLRVGLEYSPKKRWGGSIDFGIGNNFLNQWRLNSSRWNQDYSFFEIRPEIKYLIVNEKDFYLYGALEYFYSNMKARLESGSYQTPGIALEILYQSATFNKIKYGGHLKGGIHIFFLKKLNIDFYGGLGMAKRIIFYSEVINPTLGIEPIFVEWFPQNYRFEGTSKIFHMTLGIKIGYTLWKKNEGTQPTSKHSPPD